MDLHLRRQPSPFGLSHTAPKLGRQTELFRFHLLRKCRPGSDGISSGIFASGTEQPTTNRRIAAMQAILTRFIRDDSGATALEYDLIAGLIETVMVTATKTLGGKLTKSFVNVGNKL
jgi:pilus assembly protein Flp/PilA